MLQERRTIKIHFVVFGGNNPYDCFGRWSEELAARIPLSTIGTSSLPDADVNIFINYAIYGKIDTMVFSIFTHREKSGHPFAKLFDMVAQKSDWCFAQSENTLLSLPPEKSSVISIGIDKQFQKKIIIGIPTQEKTTGRKRFEWCQRLQDDFVNDIQIVYSKGGPFEDMPEFYDSLDYVLVTSNLEGGPLCIPEGISMGKTVISTDVGWAKNFPVILYNTYDELKSIISERLIDNNKLWEIGAQQIVAKLTELKEKNL